MLATSLGLTICSLGYLQSYLAPLILLLFLLPVLLVLLLLLLLLMAWISYHLQTAGRISALLEELCTLRLRIRLSIRPR